MTKKLQKANIQHGEVVPLKPKGHLAKQRAEQQGPKGGVRADEVLLKININQPFVILQTPK